MTEREFASDRQHGRNTRVLLVTGSFPPMNCGVGDYTQALAGALAGCDGTEVAVLTSVGLGAPMCAQYAVFPVMSTWQRPEFGRVLEVIRTTRPDVVHVQFPTRGYRGKLPWHLPPLLRARRIPIVQSWHEYFPVSGSLIAMARSTWRDLPLALFGRDVIVVRPDYERRMPWWFRALSVRKRFHLIPIGPTVPRVVLDESERALERERWGVAGRGLLVFFGFCSEHKGIDDVLDAMDPARHHLVIVGGVDVSDPYQAGLVGRVRRPPLAGHVTMAGFLPPGDAARVLAAADAVVLPFRTGGGSWNTSLKAAALQGTFVLTTSTETRGYDERGNVYYARPRDVAELSAALGRHMGRRVATPSADIAGPSWSEIARRHLAVYRSNV